VVVARWINSDEPLLVGIKQIVLGANSVAYCENNSINKSDFGGFLSKRQHLLKGLQLLATGLVALFTAIVKGFVRSALGSITAKVIGTLVGTALGCMPIGQYWGTVLSVATIVILIQRAKTLLFNIPQGLWHLKQFFNHNHS
jgi:hypothetical protein